MAETTPPDDTSREALVLRARAAWIERLLDRSRRNTLLYYRPLKTGTLELDGADPDAFAALLGGESVAFTKLLPEAEPARTAGVAQEIRRRAQANQEEKGIETLYLAVGLASWPVKDGGRLPEAAVLLLPVAIEARGREGRSFALRRAGDAQVSLVLLQELEAAFGLAIDAEAVLAGAGAEGEPFDPAPVLERLAGATRGIDGFVVRPRAVLGNFSYQKMAIARDLQEGAAAMAGHDLVAALAGHAGARQDVLGGRTEVDPRQLDRTPPEQEFLVLDADASQQRVVAAVLRGQDGVIHGPPGTGKSQTIVNLLAELAAYGKRTLFVAEKRAALDVVKRRLGDVGLGHLVLDLHGADLSRRQIALQIEASLKLIRDAVPADGAELHRTFAERRQRLNEHAHRMHTAHQPAGRSVFELYGELLALPPGAHATTRWRGPALATLVPTVAEEIEALLIEAGGFDGLLLRTDPSPWTPADIADGAAAEHAVDLAYGLAREHWPAFRADLEAIASQTGLTPPSSLEDARPYLDLLEEVADTLTRYQEALFEGDLPDLAAALAPGLGGGLGAFWAWCSSGDYRKARSRALGLRRPGGASVRPLADEMRDAADQERRWGARASAAAAPRAVAGLGDVGTHLKAMLDGVAALNTLLGRSDLHQLQLAELGTFLDRLAADDLTPRRLPRLRQIERQLQARGVGPLVDELRRTQPAATLWPAWFRSAWLASCLAAAQAADPAIAGFNGRTHDQFVAEFESLDRQRLELTVARVQRAYAERVIEVMNRFPEQEELIRREAAKRARHLPLRALLARAPDVLTALFPCWMASPLAVSQLIGADRRYFDVVLFDEASQVLPEDAVASLLRATHAVVAGDRYQLPPTAFFAAGDADADATQEEDAAPTAGFESLLDLMAGFLRPWPLEWHYRSKDERLIAFANHHIYGGSLVTLPSASEASAVGHVLVPSAPADGQADSASPEVTRVVELVLEHARRCPKESLGVITLGITHARRIEAALDVARRDRPELDAFFDESLPERFFVKNLEKVQGDERDAILLSTGVTKDRAGRLDYRGFGPLNGEGGRRRLNVAITRAKRRMTLVTSFTHHDMDPARAPGETGTALLRDYLQYAASGGASFGDGRLTAVAPNPFEADIAGALTAAGIPVVPQWGASRYRIDLVARHPERPGQFVLAIECDGAAYHSSPTARDRDRLRQQHLEALGWTFHRIWSTDWFQRRDEEIRRAQEAYRQAVTAADLRRDGGEPDGPPAPAPGGDTPPPPPSAPDSGARSPRPPVEPGWGIDEYHDSELTALIHWIRSDDRLRTDEELLKELMRELGFQRRGSKIEVRLQRAIWAARSSPRRPSAAA
jgi:very-short-patch-repair endonuclease